MNPAACRVCKGACCEEFFIEARDIPTSIGAPEWFRARGAAQADGSLLFECRCPHLRPSGKCGIYDTRPMACAVSPVGAPECLGSIARRRSTSEARAILAAMALPDA